MATHQHKTCTKCGLKTLIKDMEVRSDRKSGVGPWCRSCKNADRKRYARSKNYKESNKRYYYRNQDKWKAIKAKRRALKKNASFACYDKEISVIYQQCPEGYEVDHIIPLQNEIVCGLHVPWNLQYLTRFENRSKGNKLEV
jgi:hypothetical protein